MITTLGKNLILRYCAGQVASIGGSLAVGVGSTSPTLGDIKMAYELDRAVVNVTSVDFANQRVIFKGTLPQATYGAIYEVGLYSGLIGSNSSVYTSNSLLSFDSNTELWSVGAYGTNNVRIGADNLRLTAAASATTTSVLDPVYFDLSGYSTADMFALAFNADANTASVRIRLRDAVSTAYYEYTYATPVTGYNIINFGKSAFTKTGTVDWAAISSVEIAVTAKAAGTTNVDWDGLRIEDLDSNSPDNILVARTVISPSTKTNVSPSDVEYQLDLTI